MIAQKSDSSRDLAIVQLLLDSGMRLGELVGLNRDDIDDKSGSVRVFGKGSKERIVFITPETALSIIMYCVEDRPEPRTDNRLFLTVDGYLLTGGRVQKILERIGRRAGIKTRLSPHKLRHSYATLSLRHGANLWYVRRTLGHTDIKTSEIYLSLTDADVAMAHKKFSPVANLAMRKGSKR